MLARGLDLLPAPPGKRPQTPSAAIFSLAQAPRRVTHLKVILREARAPFDDFRRIDNVLPPLLHIMNPGFRGHDYRPRWMTIAILKLTLIFRSG
jgi:hypothetical protein